MTNAPSRPRVGPVLLRNELAAVVAEAIVADNPGATIVDRGGYLRILAEAPCRLRLPTLEAKLGRSFRVPMDLEPIMPAFKGRVVFEPQAVTWEAP